MEESIWCNHPNKRNYSFMKFIIPSFFILAVFISRCTYHNEEEYYDDICDTLNISYSGTIGPTLRNNCLGCHYNNNIESGIELQDYSDVKEKVDDGSLMGSITHAPGYSPMPRGNEMLDECTIAQFRNWIEQGAPNN